MVKIKILFALLWVVFAQSAWSAPVPSGANLSISIRWKDNHQLLSWHGGTAKKYNDAYKETVWIEGPYSSTRKCQISQYERQNIKLAKVLTFFESKDFFGGKNDKGNTWNFYQDYNTPDFVAALVSASMYYYCPTFPMDSGAACKGTPVLAPTTMSRQNPTIGGLDCTGASPICVINNMPGGIRHMHMGMNDLVPDGVSGATMWKNESSNISWDMKDKDGKQIEEGFYLIWVQLNAERYPMAYPQDTIINGQINMGIETCWDSPQYDTLGHHRAVNLVHFKDSGFTIVETKMKRWVGDTVDYNDGPVIVQYSVPSAVETRKTRVIPVFQTRPNPFSAKTVFTLRHPFSAQSQEMLKILNFKGQILRRLSPSQEGRFIWDGRDDSGAPVPAGIYFPVFPGSKRAAGKKPVVKLL